MTPTPRQTEVLAHLANGMTYAEIGQRLGVSTCTVHATLTRCYERLGVEGAGSSGRTMVDAFRAMGWLVVPHMKASGSDVDRSASSRIAATPTPSPRRAA